MSKKKILIVDDERTNVVLLKSMFSEEEHDVILAYDGKEGLEKAKEERPDLILLDIMMPKMDGFKVCGLLKADKRFNKIPIMIISSRAGSGDLEISKEAGADSYLLKPINREEVSKEIKRLLKNE